MALDKAICSGKEHRKPYRGSKRIDRTCRNHGSCDFCKSNRLYQTLKAMDSYKDRMKGDGKDGK